MLSIITINNGVLKLDINSLGAELFSIVNISSGRECLWQGLPEYWKSRSPVLFPIVGALYNNTMHQGAAEYSMTQHGFARASEFEVVSCESDSALFRLVSSAVTRAKYPYEFTLEIGYKLTANTLEVSYRVSNPSSEKIYFQIGAHPGLNYLDYDDKADVQGYFSFDDKGGSGDILSHMINTQGMLIESTKLLPLEDKLIAIDKNLFDDGALILEGDQASEISMLDANREPYVTVKFDAPVVGLWSSAKCGYAPFACIEPWYGRCDRDGYTGEFADKDWMQSLAPKATFETSFTITILK